MRSSIRFKPALLAGAAFLLPMNPAAAAAAPAPAAQQADQMAAMRERLDALERMVTDLKAQLAASQAAPAPLPSVITPAPPIDAQASSPTYLAASAPRPPEEKEPAVRSIDGSGYRRGEGFQVAGTTVSINGFVKLWAAETRFSHTAPVNGSLGRDLYLAQQIPITGPGQGYVFDANAKQTRIGIGTETPIAGHELTSLFEFDFQVAPGTQGTQRSTNGYNLSIRRAYVTFDNILLGQDWSTFQYTAALPETTDYAGTLDGSAFARQPMFRYSRRLSSHWQFAVSLENPETVTTTKASSALIENGTDRMPDLAARVRYKAGAAEVQLAGVLRRLSVDNGTYGANATAWGLSLAGFVPYGGKWNDLRFMVTHGSGIGRYVGLNFAPDAVYGGLPSSRLQMVDVTAAMASLRHGWTGALRSTLMAGYQVDSYPSGITATDLDRKAWSVAGNLFWSPVIKLDLGVEYRHAVREVVTGDIGTLDRWEFAAKYNF